MKKNLLKVLAIMLMLAGHFAVNSQPYDANEKKYWAFGYGRGLEFNGGIPTPVQTKIASNGQGATVADENGNLLFYTNGYTVWNKNHDTMLNGRLWERSSSSSEGQAIITSVPGEPDLYFIFSYTFRNNVVGGDSISTGVTKPDGTPEYKKIDSNIIYVSVVDMTLGNGLGSVVDSLSRKRIARATKVDNSMLAAVQGDSCNIWLLLQDVSNNNVHAYNITANGVSETPVISPQIFLGSSVLFTQNNRLKFTNDRKKIAIAGFHAYQCAPIGRPLCTNSFVTIADFDMQTGIVSNGLVLLDVQGPILPMGPVTDSEFSPDGSKLYTRIENYLYQWDISLSTPAAILGSQTAIIDTLVRGQADRTGFKLAPDGKIYFTTAFVDTTHLHAINFPNLAGAASQPQMNVIALLPPQVGTGDNRYTLSFLPHAPVLLEPLKDTVYSSKQVALSCEDTSSWQIEAEEGFRKYRWSMEDQGRILSLSDTGTYWVSYQKQCIAYVDTIRAVLESLHPDINVDEYELGTIGNYATYQWYFNGEPIPGANQSIYTVTQNGRYKVQVTNEIGCIGISEEYIVQNVAINGKMLDVWRIYPNPVNNVLHVDLGQTLPELKIKIYNLLGQVVHKKEYVNVASTSIKLDNYATGIYLIELSSDGGRRTIRIIKD